MELKTLTSAQNVDASQLGSDTGLPATDNCTNVKSYFGTLPRELRDCIYDLLYQEIEESVGNNVGDLEFLTRAIIPRLRFVSRQFKAEYDERISMNDLNQQLTATDILSCLQDPYLEYFIVHFPLTLPSHTTRLTIDMVNDWHCFPHHSYNSVLWLYHKMARQLHAAIAESSTTSSSSSCFHGN